MNNILFIGNFLSKNKGTKSPSETISTRLGELGFHTSLVSSHESKILRILDIIFSILLFKGSYIHIDVFSGQAFYIAEIATILGKIKKKKIILTLHGGRLPEFFEDHCRRVDLTLQRATKIVTPSLLLMSYFQNKGYIVEYIPNSIDTKKFPFRINNCIDPKILWVRAFSPIYNPELAVKTFSIIKNWIPNATLTMIGPDKGELRKTQYLIQQQSLDDSINILGPIPNDELYNYYHTHNIFLNTTSYESFGVAVLEAASCGIPIVSTPAGEIPLLWKHREEILISKDWSPEELSVQIIQILNDNSLSDILSYNANSKAKKYDWLFIKTKWLNIFK